jgi:hypothetical protein
MGLEYGALYLGKSAAEVWGVSRGVAFVAEGEEVAVGSSVFVAERRAAGVPLGFLPTGLTCPGEAPGCPIAFQIYFAILRLEWRVGVEWLVCQP